MSGSDHSEEDQDFDPFAGPAILGTAPSTQPQREVWTGSYTSDGASLSFNESVTLRFSAGVNVEALKDSFSDLVARHEALRMTFSPDGTAVYVTEAGPLDIPVEDWSALSPDERAERFAERQQVEVETVFDLERGPLYRAHIVRFTPDEVRAVFTAHHIVCDGWSVGVLGRDWGQLYNARLHGRAAELAPAASFTDYARAQADLEGSPAQAQHERYWLEQFKGEVPVLELPTDRPRPPSRTFAARRCDVELDAELIQAVKKAGAKLRSSLFTTMLAGFKVLVHRLSAQEDLVVGIPAAGQSVGGHDSLVGHCVNMLPLRSQLDGKQTFAALVGKVRTTMLDAYDHQEYTFGTLLTKLPLTRDPSRPPLVSIVFNVDRALTSEQMGFEGVHTEMSTNPREYENFDLFLNAVELPKGMVLECQYSTAIFDEVTVRRWLRSFEQLLRAVVADPNVAIGSIPIVSAEDQALIASWNAAANAELPAARTVHHLIEVQAAATPNAIACAFEGQELRYCELNQRANQLARKLRSLGVGRESLVGLSVERSPNVLVGLLGILKAGAAYVPLDPAYPRDRLSYMVEDSRMQVLVTEDKTRGELQLPAKHIISLDGDATALAAEDAANLPTGQGDAGPDDVAYVIYTSGSTGKPKGVLVPHLSAVNLLNSVRKRPGMGAQDAVLAVTTLSFDIAVSELILPLTVGAKIVLASREVASDGARLLDLLQSSGITFIDATPATYRLLLGAGWTGDRKLKIICTGEAMPKDLALELVDRVAEVWNGYGPTETTVWSTFYRVVRPIERILIGKPVDNTQIYILDANMQPTPVGVPGEIFIAGTGVSKGYLNRPDLTQERFLPDPFAGQAGARMYKTGDVGRFLKNGDIECLGRNDNQVKLRGYRIELGEIEDALGQHPAVRQTAVIVREDRPGDLRLVGYAALHPNASVTDADLRAHLKRSLPDYMVPAAYVRLESMPLTPSGKINRKALPAPDMSAVKSDAEFVAPSTPAQKLLAELWQEALNLPRVSIHDDFFALGGHSLLASQVLARLRRDHGIELSFRKIFEAPTLIRLAEIIERSETSAPSAGTASVERRKDGGPAPLSVSQERIWLLEEMDPAQEIVHNLPAAWLFRGPVRIEVLQRALDEIVRRHDTLRTRLQITGGQAVQVVGPVTSLKIHEVDMRDKPEGERWTHLMETVTALTREKFDLTQGPLFRSYLFQLEDQSFFYYTNRHNIIWDGWSFDVFLRELTQLYGAFDKGQPSPLKELPVSYSDYVEWHHKYLNGPSVQKQIAFWKQQLSGELPELQLATDRPRLAKTEHAGGYTTFRFTRADAEAFTGVARASGGTLFMLLFAAYNVMLHRYSGQNEILVGSPVRARNRPEVEDLIGAFINAVVLRTRLEPDMTFNELLLRIRDMTLDSFSNEDMPLERLGARPPIVRALFSLQDARSRPPSLGSIPVEQKHVELKAAANDMMIWMMDTRTELLAVVNFSTELFDKETVDRFLRGFAAVLGAVVKNPNLRIRDLPIAAPEDLAHVKTLNSPEGTELNSVASALDAVAQRGAERTAVSDGATSLSYAALLQRADGVAEALLSRTAGPNPLAAIFAVSPVDRVVATLGALRAGWAFTLLDPALPEARNAAVVAQLEPDLVLLAEGVELPVSIASNSLQFGVGTQAAQPARALELAGRAPAWVSYRVAADGRILPAVVSQAALASSALSLAKQLGIEAGDTVVGLSTPTAELALIEVLATLLAGATLILPGAAARLDKLSLGKAKADFVFAPDTSWARASAAELALVERAVLLSEPSAELLKKLLEAGLRVVRVHAYAQAGFAPFAQQLVSEDQNKRIGRPLFPTRLAITGSDAQLTPAVVPGALAVGSAFPVDPARNRWQRSQPQADLTDTNERARFLNDGSVEVSVAEPGIIRAAGHRFTTAEIAGALTGHRAIADAHVRLVRAKNGTERLTAYVAVKPDVAYTETELRKHLRGVLPDYMVPQSFLEVEVVPRATSGEVDEVALQANFASEDGQTYVAPRSATERMLAGLWQEALGAPQVGLYDNFFDLGGYSLLCFKVIASIEEKTKVRIGPRVMLLGSLEQVAVAVDAAAPGGASVATPSRQPSAPVESRAEPTSSGGLFKKLRDIVKGGRD